MADVHPWDLSCVSLGCMDATARRVLARDLAQGQGGVVSRRQLRSVGITHDHVRNEVAAERWVALGRHTVAVHGGPLPIEAEAWSALWEVGERIAALDGVTSLLASGLTGFEEDLLHLSVRHSHDIRQIEGVRIHKVIRRLEGELMPSGIPRTRPAVAAIRAAGWAVSDRQAALLLLMPIQQRLTTPDALLAASRCCLGRRRRAFIKAVIGDVAVGIQSLGELDFARLCRTRGLPEPSRQVVREGPRGRIYLDVRWERRGLVVEIDGTQHREGLAVSIDNLTRNAVMLSGDRVLRIDRVGLRLHEDAFMGQVALGLAVATSR